MLYKHFLDELEKKANYPQPYPPQQPYPYQPPERKSSVLSGFGKALGAAVAVNTASNVYRRVAPRVTKAWSAARPSLTSAQNFIKNKASSVRDGFNRRMQQKSDRSVGIGKQQLTMFDK